MSKSKFRGDHIARGKFAMYLEDENPNCPAGELGDRYRNHWDRQRRVDSLPRVRANYKCPECRSSAVFYTDTLGLARCEGCGLSIYEGDTDADEIVKEGL